MGLHFAIENHNFAIDIFRCSGNDFSGRLRHSTFRGNKDALESVYIIKDDNQLLYQRVTTLMVTTNQTVLA
jgi:hypothetical protein